MRAKRCSTCGLTKVLECFYRSSNVGGGPQAHCKACHREKARASYRRRYPARAEHERARVWWRYRLDPRYRRRTIERSTARKRRVREAAREDVA